MDDPSDRVHPETADAWRSWLADNHTRDVGVWVVSWKQHTGRPRVSYEDAVTEALAFGWVDSKAVTLDDDRSMLWYSPRRPKSAWSRPNKQRVERLLAEGRMTPAGQRMVDLARASGTWSLLDDVEDLIVPDDLAAAFAARPGAAAHWDAFPRSVRRGILEWIVQAKRPETRANRVRETAERAAKGERANQWR
ncbi:YdeI/OmpD-associated family protein [Pengzhenrongella phosphoraccumulans]|uniref:YdeI/OmpD-associated family protein n=1 Tax=Pengzhenrongella phosphoraccumulans TaxID=3114394 RepID=UPI00388EA10B